MIDQAMQCAAQLMGASPAPVRWVETMVGPAFCEVMGHTCAGAFIAWSLATGTPPTIYAPAYPPLLVEESCHAIQHHQGRPLGDPECDWIRKRSLTECH